MQFVFDINVIYTLLGSLGLIILDAIFGWFKSYKEGTFDFALVPQFIKTNIFPYIGGLTILALFSMVMTDVQYVFYGATALVATKFGKEILLEKVTALFK